MRRRYNKNYNELNSSIFNFNSSRHSTQGSYFDEDLSNRRNSSDYYPATGRASLPATPATLSLRRMSSIWNRKSSAGRPNSQDSGFLRIRPRFRSATRIHGNSSSRSYDQTSSMPYIPRPMSIVTEPEQLPDTHTVTSVMEAIRILGEGGSGQAVRANSTIEPSQLAPFLLIEHDGPRAIAKGRRSNSRTDALAGMHALVYVLRGGAIIWNARPTVTTTGGKRLRAGDAALIDARSGALMRTDPINDGTDFEALRVWIRVGGKDEMKDLPAIHSLTVSRALPSYGVYDVSTRKEIAHSTTLIGDFVPLCDSECIRSTSRSLLSCDNKLNEKNAAKNIGVYNMRIIPGATVRLQLRTNRVHIYVREGKLKVGLRTISKGSTAILHGGKGGGFVTVTADALSAPVGCFIFEGEAAVEKLHFAADGIAASSSRHLRKLQRKRDKGGFGTFPTDKLGTILQEVEKEVDEEMMTPI